MTEQRPPEGWQPPPGQPQQPQQPPPGWGPQPGWGAPPPPRPPRKGWTTGRIVAVSLLGILVVLVLIGALAGEPPPQDSSPQATQAPTTEPATTTPPTTPTTIATTVTTAAPTTTKPPMLRMPNVRRRILYEAMTALEDAGFNLDNVEYRWRLEDNGPPINPTNWAVVSQKPAPGTRVRPGTKVTLNVVRTDTGF